MKIRLSNQEIRVRLSRFEIEQILEGKAAENSISLPTNTLTFSLHGDSFTSNPWVDIENHHCKIILPHVLTIQWKQNLKEVICFQQAGSLGNSITIKIEMDLKHS